jgi:hypothetical protein
VEDQNDFDKMKSTLEELLASFREMQQDIYFIKTRYVKPVKAIKTKVSKEQRKTMIINKMLTRGKRID